MIMREKVIIGIIMFLIGTTVIVYGTIWMLKKKVIIGIIILLIGAIVITYSTIWMPTKLGKTINAWAVSRTKTKKMIRTIR